MFIGYIKFFVNGGVLGLAAWAIQFQVYKVIGSDSSFAYALSSVISYIPLIFINFAIQRSLIFKNDGLLFSFIVANISIMLLVSIFSPLCRDFIDIILGRPWGDRCGYILASLICSIPSYLIKRVWVFGIPLR